MDERKGITISLMFHCFFFTLIFNFLFNFFTLIFLLGNAVLKSHTHFHLVYCILLQLLCVILHRHRLVTSKDVRGSNATPSSDLPDIDVKRYASCASVRACKKQQHTHCSQTLYIAAIITEKKREITLLDRDCHFLQAYLLYASLRFQRRIQRGGGSLGSDEPPPPAGCGG